MIDIMLVDDDEMLLKGLTVTIDWKELGCNIVATCRGYKEAVAAFKEHRPKIVITDICMPGEDGFQLISELQKLSDNVQCIILTGFADFDYAKLAVEYNVSSFLLKPTNAEDVVEAVKKAKTRLCAQEASLVFRQNDLLLGVLQERISVEELKESGVIPEEYRKSSFVVSILSIDSFHKLPEQNHVSSVLRNITDYQLSVNKQYILQCYPDSRTIVILIFLRELYSNTSLFDLLKCIQFKFAQQTEGSVTIGMSGIYKNIDMIRRAYAAAKEALEMRAVLGRGCIIEHPRMKVGNQIPPQFTSEEMYHLIMHIKKMDLETCTKMINDFFAKINQIDSVGLADIKNNIEELAILIIHECVKSQLEMKKVFHRIVKPVVEIEVMEIVSDMKAWLLGIITSIIENPQIMIAGITRLMVQDAVIYIMKHYAEALSVETAANVLGVSPRHLSRQFKEETGKTFVEYLTEYRINIAKELLEHSRLKVYEIGQAVGYSNFKYFGKVFKEFTGVTPIFYRDNIGF